ncbi:MAG: YbfB/YjiJ family MFS transporter [Ferrimicrobium sp.]
MSRSQIRNSSAGPTTMTIVVTLALAPAVVLGFARFAYALLLPPMRADLGWSLSTAGAMNSANALGYLVGALASAACARRIGARRSFLIAFAVTVASLLLTALTGDVVVLLVLRAAAGISGAVAFITGAGLVAQIAQHSQPRKAVLFLGVYFAGGGAGIVISGLTVPALLAVTHSTTGWRWGWVLLGIIGAIAFIPAWLGAKRSEEPPAQPRHDRRWPMRSFVPVLGAYGLFGVGYIAYMTFIVAFLHQAGAGAGEITAFWSVLGISSVAGAFLWVRPISHLRGANSVAVVLAAVALGAILPLISRSVPIALVSAIFFGGSFLAVVTSVTSVTRRSLPPHHWTPAIATLTVAFAVGQIIGPELTGLLSEGAAGLKVGLGVSAALLVGAALTALKQRPVGDLEPSA